MPAESPGFLTLFYVGVVPMMQGQGYVNDLLSAGTATLLKTRSKHDKPLIADTDVSNAPMPPPSNVQDGRGSPEGKSTSSACQHYSRSAF
jgi:hypothetical protein